MNKTIVVGLISTAILAAGLLIGAGLGSLNRAEARSPMQSAGPGEGWSVQNFRTITFAEKSWKQVGQEGSCVAFSSLPQRSLDPDRRHIPAAMTVVTETFDFTRHYPRRGARVLVCAGFTLFMSPLNSGLPP